MNALEALRAIQAQIGLLRAELEGVVAEAKYVLSDRETMSGADFIPAVGTALGSVIELLSLFRVNREFKYVKFAIEDRALVSAVAGKLAAAGIATYDTATMPIGLNDQPPASGIAERVEELHQLRLQLVALQARLPREAEEEKPGGIEGQAAGGVGEPAVPKKPDNGQAEELASARTKISSVLARLDAFWAALTKADEPSGTTRLAVLLDAERLSGMIDRDTCFLWLKAVTAGGGSRTERTLIWSKISYSGGAIVSFALYDRSGVVLDAGTMPLYSGFVSIDPIDPPAWLITRW